MPPFEQAHNLAILIALPVVGYLMVAAGMMLAHALEQP